MLLLPVGFPIRVIPIKFLDYSGSDSLQAVSVNDFNTLNLQMPYVRQPFISNETQKDHKT
ncbi:MAG: hypothetical protein ACJAT1_001068 [Marivirga sp.]|jgi:hypothetical protein